MASFGTMLRKSVMPMAIAMTTISCNSCKKEPTPEPQPKFPVNLVTDAKTLSFDRAAGMMGSEVVVLFDYNGKGYRARNSFSGGTNANATFKFQKADLTDANTIIEIEYDEYDVGSLKISNMPANKITLEFKDNAELNHTYSAKTVDLSITPQTILYIGSDQHKEDEARNEWEKMNRAEKENFADQYIKTNIGATGQREMKTWMLSY